MSSAEVKQSENFSVIKENFVISDGLQFAPFRSFDEFLVKARFETPTFETKKWNSRLVQNLLYFQTNYFLLFFFLFTLLSFFQASDVVRGISAVAVFMCAALVAFTLHDQIKQFCANHPHVVRAIVFISRYYAISQLAWVLRLILTLAVPVFVVLLHSSLCLRELSSKVNYNLENAKLRKTVMFSLLQTLGLQERL